MTGSVCVQRVERAASLATYSVPQSVIRRRGVQTDVCTTTPKKHAIVSLFTCTQLTLYAYQHFFIS